MLAMSEAAAQPQSKAPIKALVPMIRVADVERSAKFYQLLGFEIGNYVPREAPPMHWAWLYQPEAPNWKTGANLMLMRSEEKPQHELPVVLYLYTPDLVALRQQLIGGD